MSRRVPFRSPERVRPSARYRSIPRRVIFRPPGRVRPSARYRSIPRRVIFRSPGRVPSVRIVVSLSWAADPTCPGGCVPRVDHRSESVAHRVVCCTRAAAVLVGQTAWPARGIARPGDRRPVPRPRPGPKPQPRLPPVSFFPGHSATTNQDRQPGRQNNTTGMASASSAVMRTLPVGAAAGRALRFDAPQITQKPARATADVFGS